MTRLKWSEEGKRFYETGAEQGVLFVKNKGTYENGVPWDGLTKFSVNPTGGESTAVYANDIKYLNLVSAEETEGTIEALTFPDEFEECQGHKEVAKGVYAAQQSKKLFGFVCKTLIGNDEDGDGHAYRIHIIYNAMAAPTQIDHETINKDPNTVTMSWGFTTTPVSVDVANVKPTAYLTVDSRKTDSVKLKALEDKLFGSESTESELPSPKEVIALVGATE